MPRQKRHGSRKIEAAATKPQVFQHHAAVDENEKAAPRATRKRKERRGKEKPPRKPCGGNPESILFYLSYPLCGVHAKDFLLITPRVSRAGKRQKRRREVQPSFLRRGMRQGRALKRRSRVLSPLPCIKKRNVLSQERSFYSFSAFFCLARKASPFLYRTSNISSFRTARRAFFFLSGGLAEVFLPYSGFLSIAA